MECEICGKVVTCQMYSHFKSNKCKLKQQQKEIESLKEKLTILKTEE